MNYSLTKLVFGLLLAAGPWGCWAAGDVKFAPYYDTFLQNRKDLADIARATGQLDYHLAFALGGHQGCKPMWGGIMDINDPIVINPIKAVQQMGGKMIIATGGALGPYLEHLCGTPDALANAYMEALDAVGTHRIDLDIEAPVDVNLMSQALLKLKQARPNTTISFTLMVQTEDYGLNPALGSDVLKAVKAAGVEVDTCNVMAMEMGTVSPDYGDAVIGTARTILRQLKEIYPEKSDAEIRKMMGVTPMIGRNYSGKVFEVAHARKLVDFAKSEGLGLLAFWSVERDNGSCAGTVSPYCSGTTQQDYEFTQIFQGFR